VFDASRLLWRLAQNGQEVAGKAHEISPLRIGFVSAQSMRNGAGITRASRARGGVQKTQVTKIFLSSEGGMVMTLYKRSST
jgi:hypothetical protein